MWRLPKVRSSVTAGAQGSISFSETMRALESDGFRRPFVLLLLVAVLLGAWATWFFRARVSIYEVSDQARIEIDQAIYPVDALLTGRTVTSNLTVGRSVQAGEVL